MNILKGVILKNIMKRKSLAYKVGYIEEETPSLIFENNIKIGYFERGNPQPKVGYKKSKGKILCSKLF